MTLLIVWHANRVGMRSEAEFAITGIVQARSGKVVPCQSTTLHIGLHTFPTHLQCISEALPHTLTHCVSDSACYTTPHCPLHPCLHTCCLRLFVCLFVYLCHQ